MISIRIRKFGATDWTYIRIEGEDEEGENFLAARVIDLLDDEAHHTQVSANGGPWVNTLDEGDDE